MYPAFDVFKREPGDRFLWIGSAGSLSEANAKIREQKHAGTEFVIVNEDTGERTVIKPVEPREKTR